MNEKIEKIRQFLDYLKTDPEAGKKLTDLKKPENGSEDELLKYYAEAAARLGYDLTESDLRSSWKELTTKRALRTEEVEKSIMAISDSELENVAGGKGGYGCATKLLCYDVQMGDENCRQTFQSGEDCAYNDGCDKTVSHYEDYECRANYNGFQCGSAEANACEGVFF